MSAYREPGKADVYVEAKEMTEGERTFRLARAAIVGGSVFLTSIVLSILTSSIYEIYAREHRPVVVPTTPLDDCVAHGGTYDARWSRCDPPREAK